MIISPLWPHLTEIDPKTVNFQSELVSQFTARAEDTGRKNAYTGSAADSTALLPIPDSISLIYDT